MLPLLRRNYENNLSPAALRGEDWACSTRVVGARARGSHPWRLVLRSRHVRIVLERVCMHHGLCSTHVSAPAHPTPWPAASGDGDAAAVGRVRVAELDWAQPDHFTGGGQGGTGVVVPPFDIILAADCIYHEHVVRHLYRAVLALSTERTTILVANERRSETVQTSFLELFAPSFTFKKVRG